MGPGLTLNVLLSFAQFEREVIGERVRDKIAASKRNRASGSEARSRSAIDVSTRSSSSRPRRRRPYV